MKGLVMDYEVEAALEQEVMAKAEAMALQHQQDIIDTREAFVKDAIAKGYNLKEWTVCDNLLDIKSGKTLEYKIWLSKLNPTGEQN